MVQKKMKTVIYSCVTGRYDDVLATVLASKALADEHTDFVLFSDRPDLVEAGVDEVYRQVGGHLAWTIRPVKYKHPTCNVRTARWHKINSHLSVPEYDYSLWIDGSQTIKGVNLRSEVIEPYFSLPESKSQPVATFKHPDRTCVYQEAVACRKLRKDNPILLAKQVQSYRDEDYPPYNGMVETACVVRNNSVAVRRFNEFWWNQLTKFSRRDQLGFNYTSWKTGIGYGHICGHRARSPYFEFVPHKKR
jgi:hypothetical protein